VAAFRQFIERAFVIRYLRIVEGRPVKDHAAPVEHPNQKAARIFGKIFEPGDEFAMLVSKNRAVGLDHKGEHFGEMIEVVIDRKDWQLHP
jgi:hypothetical protein